MPYAWEVCPRRGQETGFLPKQEHRCPFWLAWTRKPHQVLGKCPHIGIWNTQGCCMENRYEIHLNHHSSDFQLSSTLTWLFWFLTCCCHWPEMSDTSLPQRQVTTHYHPDIHPCATFWTSSDKASCLHALSLLTWPIQIPSLSRSIAAKHVTRRQGHWL